MQTTLKRTALSPAPSSAKWELVNPEFLPSEWLKYRPLVLRALLSGEGSFNERDVMFALLSSQWRLFAMGDPVRSICILEPMQYPRQRKCVVRYVVGDLSDFIDTVSSLEEVARAMDCTVIEAYARKGWARKLKGWKQKYVILQRDL